MIAQRCRTLGCVTSGRHQHCRCGMLLMRGSNFCLLCGLERQHRLHYQPQLELYVELVEKVFSKAGGLREELW